MSLIQSKIFFKKLSTKSTWIGCAVVLSMLVISCATQVTNPISPTATLDEKIVLQESLIQVLGNRLTEISYNIPERADITIIWTINENSTKINAQIDATNILKALEHHKTRFIYVILIGTFSIQDEQGNMYEIQVIDLGFNKSKLEKVNWEIFQPSDIYNLADVAVIADEWK